MAKKSGTTTRDGVRRKFAEHFAKWQTILNLSQWRFVLADKDAPKGVYADVSMDYPNRIATVRVSPSALAGMDEQLISDVALHEVLHLFLEDLHKAYATNSQEAAGAAEHGAIQVLMRLLGSGKL